MAWCIVSRNLMYIEWGPNLNTSFSTFPTFGSTARGPWRWGWCSRSPCVVASMLRWMMALQLRCGFSENFVNQSLGRQIWIECNGDFNPEVQSSRCIHNARVEPCWEMDELQLRPVVWFRVVPWLLLRDQIFEAIFTGDSEWVIRNVVFRFYWLLGMQQNEALINNENVCCKFDVSHEQSQRSIHAGNLMHVHNMFESGHKTRPK